MKRELGATLKWRLAAFLAGLFGFAALEALCMLAFGLGLAGGLYMRSLPVLLASMAAGVLLLACSFGLQACYWSRRILLEFGRWQHAPQEADATQERRAMLSGARDAFDQGDFARSAGLLKRYLDIRPQDNLARLNFASSLCLAGDFQGSSEALELAGDPHKALQSLPTPAQPWGRPGPGSFRRASAGLILPLLALSGFLASLVTAAALSQLLSKRAAEFLQSPSPGVYFMNLAKRYGSAAGAGFKTFESEHFKISYHDENFARKTAQVAEEALRFNTEFFGLPISLFDSNKIKLTLMNNQADYMKWAPLAKPWEAAVTMDELQEIYAYRAGRGREWYFENTLAHEISHVCYRKVLPQIEKGSWLNEGLAEHIGYDFALGRMGFPKAAWLKANVFKSVAEKPLPFEAFLSGNPQRMNEMADIRQFYDQGYSIVYVLITYYGKDEFLKFLRAYSRKREISEALREAYPSISGVKDLQGIWLLFVK